MGMSAEKRGQHPARRAPASSRREGINFGAAAPHARRRRRPRAAWRGAARSKRRANWRACAPPPPGQSPRAAFATAGGATVRVRSSASSSRRRVATSRMHHAPWLTAIRLAAAAAVAARRRRRRREKCVRFTRAHATAFSREPASAPEHRHPTIQRNYLPPSQPPPPSPLPPPPPGWQRRRWANRRATPGTAVSPRIITLSLAIAVACCSPVRTPNFVHILMRARLSCVIVIAIDHRWSVVNIPTVTWVEGDGVPGPLRRAEFPSRRLCPVYWNIVSMFSFHQRVDERETSLCRERDKVSIW